MKGIFEAGELTFSVNAEHISEVVNCPEIKGAITKESECVGTVQIRDIAVPIINTLGADEKTEKLVLVIEYENKEVGVLINSVLGLQDYSNLKPAVASERGLTESYYFDPKLNKNVVNISLSALFSDSRIPSIKKRVFDNELKNIEKSDNYYLTMEANGKLFAIHTSDVVTTLVDFSVVKGNVTGDCYIGDITYENKRIACLDYGCLVGLNAPKGERNILILVRVGEGILALNVDKIYDVSMIDNNAIMPFPKVGGEENWYSEIIIKEETDSSKESDKFIYVLSSEELRKNESLVSITNLYKNEITEVDNNDDNVNCIIIGLDAGNRTEYYSIPTAEINDIFTAPKNSVGFSACDLVSGITTSNGEAFTVVNTKKLLGLLDVNEDTEPSKSNFVTFSIDDKNFAFEVDKLVEVTSATLVSKRPELPRENCRVKDDNYFCLPAKSFFHEKSHVINMLYMTDIITKILGESELGDNTLKVA